MGVERERARVRQLATLKQGVASPVREYVPERGQARDIVGEKLGVSGRHIEKSIKVVEKIDSLMGDGDTEKAGDPCATLNASVSKARYPLFHQWLSYGFPMGPLGPLWFRLFFPAIVNTKFTGVKGFGRLS